MCMAYAVQLATKCNCDYVKRFMGLQVSCVQKHVTECVTV